MILPSEIIVDLFAGGGGASQGIYEATGRHPDVAVNHDPIAIGVHGVNHPETEHHCASVWRVDPREAVRGRPVGLLWGSPDCRHFSRAAGAGPKSKSVRSLPGVLLTWANRVLPRVIVVENVREMLSWGPLLADGTPCPDRVGRSFNQWVGRLRGLGYKVEWRELCAADFGAPTIRTRLFVVARCDDEPISWPQPTHGRRPGLFERPWRAASECIDWSIPCRSIFDRPRPLKTATMRRIAHGVRRYVLGSHAPFIVRTGHWSHRTGEGFGFRGQGVDAPLATVATINDKAVVVPHVSSFYGQSIGSSVDAPLGTITSASEHHALVSAFLAQHNLGAVGHSAREPLSTITTAGTNQNLVEARLSADDIAGAERVAAFLISYYGTGGQTQPLDTPLGTITTLAGFALVTVNGVGVPIVDIGMRMLTPVELQRAQGFPDDYVITHRDDGKPVNKTGQIRLLGNSVCPPMAAAVVRGLFGSNQAKRKAA
jgi:DNA (cytosine-5)-methyltransferase 1